eukprot:gene17811-24189_t
MVTCVAQVGVDINLAANVMWRRDVLHYVPGLGPRKARALIASIQRNGNKVESRNEMYRELGVLGKTVFRNCGSYLRVTSAGLPQLANLEFRQLDASRVHPESYRLAVAICERAIGEEDVEGAVEEHPDKSYRLAVAICERAIGKEDVEGAVEEHPDKIEQVELMSLAEEKQIPQKLATLINIQQELLQPGGEIRGVLAPLHDREVFYLQYGEDDDTLRTGRLVEAKVVYVGRDEVKCRLSHSPIEAIILREFLSSRPEMDHANLKDHIQRDQTLLARIMKFGSEEGRDGTKHFVVSLDASGDSLKDTAKWEERYCKKKEPSYKVATQQELDAALKVASALRKEQGQVAKSSTVQVIARPIRHPLFQNVSMKVAGEELSKKERPVGDCIVRPAHGIVAGEELSKKERPVGDCIVRPAHGDKGANTLCCSMKVFHGQSGAVIQHVDVKEAAKKSGLGLSTPLMVEVIPKERGAEGRGDRPQNSATAMQPEDLDGLHANCTD